MPVLTVFAGPNGSGKSSIIQRVDFIGRANLLEADAIANRLRPDDAPMAVLTAGREVLNRAQQYLNLNVDFAIETTLSGNWTTRVIQQAVARHFFVRLLYICLDTPEQAIQRIRERVVQGGHAVPDHDVRRRYWRSLSKLRQVIAIVDETIVFDNAGPEPRLLLEIRSDDIVSKSSQLPYWAQKLVEKIRM